MAAAAAVYGKFVGVRELELKDPNEFGLPVGQNA
jgi:hypothetical protein